MVENNSVDNKRHFGRVRVSLTVFFRINKPLTVQMVIGGKLIEATMVDLSEAGMAILTKHNIPTSSEMLIRFTLFRSDEQDIGFYGPVEIVGEVQYNNRLSENEYRLGVVFVKIDEKDKVEIKDFVKKTGNLLGGSEL